MLPPLPPTPLPDPEEAEPLAAPTPPVVATEAELAEAVAPESDEVPVPPAPCVALPDAAVELSLAPEEPPCATPAVLSEHAPQSAKSAPATLWTLRLREIRISIGIGPLLVVSNTIGRPLLLQAMTAPCFVLKPSSTAGARIVLS